MLKVVLTFLVWAGLSYPIFRFIGPVAVVSYGMLSMAGFLLWAATRKK